MKEKDLKGKTAFLMGDEACAEGALSAGCDFYAGYPITPASEIMHHMARKMPELGRKFIQMEDEIGSIAAIVGASWAGAKSMTATSGPGFSLMIEILGYAYFTETPCVITDVQRAGPSTGQATRPGQGDVMQVRWGCHGDYSPIALSPWTAQDMYSMTARSFSLAEEFRMPIVVLGDETIGHLREKVVLHENLYPWKRKKTNQAPFGDPKTNRVTPMPTFGEGRQLLVTGSTHDHWGYRRTTDSPTHEKLIKRLNEKMKGASKKLPKPEWYGSKKPKALFVAYGISARTALGAVELLAEKNIDAALLRLPVLWPFPETEVRKAVEKVPCVIVPELNRGQMVREIERLATRATIFPCNKVNGENLYPEELVDFARKNISRRKK